MFQVPPRTPYDLNFSIFGISVQVHPLFWLITLLFGYQLGSVSLVLTWIVVVFVSILIHELGHSLMMRFFGQDSYIVLHSMGGLAIPTTGRWGDSSSEWSRQIAISLAGPFAGFLFAAVTIGIGIAAGGRFFVSELFGFLPFPNIFFPGSEFVQSLIFLILYVNIFWGLINLLPVFPLDGGKVAQSLFVRANPWTGFQNSLWLSVIVGGLVAVISVMQRSYYIAFFVWDFGISKLSNVAGWRSSRFLGMFYRVWQFWQALFAFWPLPQQAWQEIEMVLMPAELALFRTFSLSDQWHSYRVMQDLQGCDVVDKAVLTAALLHDIGKTRVRIRIWERVIAVVLKRLLPDHVKDWGQGEAKGWKRPFVVRAQHPEWGAQMVEKVGTAPLTVSLIRRHQDKVMKTAVTDEDRLLHYLQWADDRN